MRRRILSYILLLGMVSAFLGCGGTNKGARVIDVPRPPSYEYWVKSGDTLYSIAWRHEMDFTELARINNIAHPYRIFPDQRLKVSNPPLNAQASDEPGATTSRRSTTAATPPPAVAKPPANLPDKQPVASLWPSPPRCPQSRVGVPPLPDGPGQVKGRLARPLAQTTRVSTFNCRRVVRYTPLEAVPWSMRAAGWEAIAA